ncbi:MAG: ATP-binding protein [Thermodesulfobacteriota bacterium]
MSQILNLTVETNAAGLAESIGRANAWFEARKFSERVVYLANLVLEEVLTNINKYAFDDDDIHDVQVKLEHEQGQLLIEIEDDGKEFNPLLRTPPDLNRSLDRSEAGGLGIHLVRNLADFVEYERMQGKNVLRVRLQTARRE